MAPTESKKRLALAIIDFLGNSLNDGTLTVDDSESIEIAQTCIADTFKVDPSDKAAMQDALGGQSLATIYSVYEKMKGKSSSASSVSASETKSAATSQSGAPNEESEKLKSQGNAAMARKDYPTAISLYTQALNIAPSNPIYLSNRAAAYSASGNHAKAVEDAEIAVAADPKYVKGWSRLGLARFALGNAKGAAEAYQKGIDAEGNGGSESMRKGLETAKKRIEDMKRGEDEPLAEDIDEAPGTSRGGGGAGGMPDLSSLAGMFGGSGGGSGGMPDLSSIMSNPMFASMAQNLMSNPDMMSNLMNNPRIRQMAESFGAGGGGAGAGQGGLPDMASMMNDPNFAEMARNLMGGGAGRGAGRGS
ncbi:small glutamine-rich tetratricopeptide repeat-containing protein [Histoplasma capsulatum G186AR]|uniref:Small glutamine-rich tetratricopeptide repeat-containing protein n=2 Tax=Ajellomyces capsulatus TaxID=5037 RepID=C0NJG8_AJECG|nr:small glutamine-rich tetratricopeptide repeat-containing protein [Histoplasma capsulatum G186AR]EEH08009.1 small glutamine-rich tetratricopeptide repeat-containing protein [Histoplasma capsulatum G186AR]KAG5299669.1 small glutamine-rich tetratricopeptide repeat-containing protein [Histoplasma capsulatum]QSS67705.1 small glutamine-rich tetratricopeptide repeat-containing protein [Histoplasma capsulatum G186AR]